MLPFHFQTRRICGSRNSLIFNKNTSFLLISFLFGSLPIFRIIKIANYHAVILFEPVHLLPVEDRDSCRFASSCVSHQYHTMLRRSFDLDMLLCISDRSFYLVYVDSLLLFLLFLHYIGQGVVHKHLLSLFRFFIYLSIINNQNIIC